MNFEYTGDPGNQLQKRYNECNKVSRNTALLFCGMAFGNMYSAFCIDDVVKM